MAPSDTGSLSVAVIRSRGSWIHRLGGTAVAGGLLLLAGASSSAKRARRMVAGLLLLLLLLQHRAGATTVSEELASGNAYASCYDPAGVSCTCTGINLNYEQLTGTIPAELSACTGLKYLCVCSRAAVTFRPAPLSPTHARRRRWLEKAENGRSSRVFFFTAARVSCARRGVRSHAPDGRALPAPNSLSSPHPRHQYAWTTAS